MKCPKCGSEFEKVTYAGVTIDRCLTCKGIWLDILEAETLRKVKGSAELDVGSAKDEESDAQVRDIVCPKCQTKMTKLVDKRDATLTYEKCPVCYGVWFAAGNFRSFRQRGFLWSIKRLISREERGKG